MTFRMSLKHEGNFEKTPKNKKHKIIRQLWLDICCLMARRSWLKIVFVFYRFVSRNHKSQSCVNVLMRLLSN